jgi:hypothetical protein
MIIILDATSLATIAVGVAETTGKLWSQIGGHPSASHSMQPLESSFMPFKMMNRKE